MGNPFRNSYKAEVRIKSEKAKVWNTLTDLDNYHLWNPFTPKIETNWKIGERVILTVQMKKGKKPIRQIEYLNRLNKPDELAWGMNWGFFLKAERIQRLSTDEHGFTNYFTEDVIEGILNPLVHLLYGRFIQKGFDLLAQSLKKYMENS